MRRIAVALAVVLALAVAYTFLARRQQGREREERAQARLLQFDERQLEGFVLATSGQDWRFTFRDGAWTLEAPVRDVASDGAIREFLQAMRTTPVQRVISDPDELSAYGLEPAVATVRLLGVEAPELHLGTRTPTGEGIFARVAGRPGVLVLDQAAGRVLLEPDPNRLRQASVTGIVQSELRAIEVTPGAGGAGFRIEREADGWWLARPRRLPASERAVGRLLEGLESLRATAFFDGPPDVGRFGLGPGATRIELVGSRARRQLVVGTVSEGDTRFATRDDRDTVIGFDGSGLDALPASHEPLLADRLTRVNRYKVRSFTYRVGPREISARRDGERWLDAAGRELVDEDVYDLLVSVLDRPVRGWSAGAAPGTPVASLTYVLEGGGEDTVDLLPGGRVRLGSLPGVVATTEGDVPEPHGSLAG